MGARYLLSAGITLFVLCVAGALLGAALPGVDATTLVIAVGILYPVGLLLDVLPPGRPGADRRFGPDELDRDYAELLHDWEERETPLVPMRGMPKLAPEYLESQQRRGPSSETLMISGVFALLGVGLFTAVATGTGGGGNADNSVAALLGGEQDAPSDAVAGVQPPEPTVAAAAPTETPTPEPTEAAAETPAPTETPAATEPPATLTPAAPTPTPDPRIGRTEAGQAGWATGRWEVTDTVTVGPSAGQAYTFLVDMTETSGQIVGSGNGLTLQGQRDGMRLRVDFSRPGESSGVFEWTQSADGRLIGTFTDNGSSGVSVARRLY